MLDAKEKNCIQIWEKLRQKVIAYSRDEMGELDSEEIQGLIETWKKALKDERETAAERQKAAAAAQKMADESCQGQRRIDCTKK